MAKTKTGSKKKTTKLTENRKAQDTARRMLYSNALQGQRSSSLQKLLFPERNINYECKYPDVLSIADYQSMYDREAVAKRVVRLFPDKCWATFPEIQETDDPEATEFETKWAELVRKRRVFHFLHRGDILSGIGQFGVLLLGINDSKTLDEPVEGVDELTGERTGNHDYELMYMKPFNEKAVSVKSKETNPASPRFGLPVLYTIEFEDTESKEASSTLKTVHWTRLIHLADNREVSDIYGVPRMKSVYNRLIDIQKISSGSAEMFWKGAFQGLSFETFPDMDTSIDTDALKEQMEDYQNGLQRYLAISNMTAKSLAPQVADPGSHVDVQLELIAIDMGVPKRMLMGSEEAKLASQQDTQNFNASVASRQEHYVTPLVIRPLVDRLIVLGVLPEIESYEVIWEDLDTPTDEDKANVVKIQTEALAKYVQASVDALIPPEEYLSMFLGLSAEQIEIIKKSSLLWNDVGEDDDINGVTEPDAE